MQDSIKLHEEQFRGGRKRFLDKNKDYGESTMNTWQMQVGGASLIAHQHLEGSIHVHIRHRNVCEDSVKQRLEIVSQLLRLISCFPLETTGIHRRELNL